MAVLAFLLAILGVFITLGAVVDTATRRRRFPNWSEATRTFLASKEDRAEAVWQLCYYRDTPGAPLYYRYIAVTGDGLLARDLAPCVFPRPRTILVPWCSLSNPKETNLPLYFLRLWRQAIELEVKGTKISLVVSREMWRRFRRNVTV